MTAIKRIEKFLAEYAKTDRRKEEEIYGVNHEILKAADLREVLALAMIGAALRRRLDQPPKRKRTKKADPVFATVDAQAQTDAEVTAPRHVTSKWLAGLERQRKARR